MSHIPALNSNNHILYLAPQGRIAIFSIADALLAFQYLPLTTEVYAIYLPSMKVERVDCVSRAVDFFERMK